MNLKEITQIRAGHAFRKKLVDEPDEDVRVIQMKDLHTNGEIYWNSMIRTAPVAHNTDWVSQGDLLLVSRGANNIAYFIHEKPVDRALAAPYFFHITVTQDAREFITPEFLAWQLNQNSIQNYFKKNSEGSTSKAIRREIVENTHIAIPTLSEQRSIVSLHQNLTLQKRKQQLLIENSEALMNKIAADFLNKPTPH